VIFFREDKKETKWIIEATQRHRHLFDHETRIQVLSPNDFLIPYLDQSGLYVEEVMLVGSVDSALEGLKKKYPWLSEMAPKGFRFEPVQTEEQIRQCLMIFREEFTRNPQYGWFCTTPGFLNVVSQGMRQSMKSKRPHEFVMLDGEEVAGQFGFSPPLYFPHLKARRAGIGITSHKRVQGKGFAKYYYFYLLSRMKEQRVKYFIGSTAQKPVMDLAKTMKRTPIQYVLSGKKYFDPDHFAHIS
jgi:hypothetical protein